MVVDDLPIADVVRAGLRYEMSDTERDVLSSPPDYSLPGPLLPHQARIFRELEAARVPGDPGPPTVKRIMSTVLPFDTALRSLKRPGGFDFPDAACLLVSCGVMGIESARELLEVMQPLRALGLQRQIVLTHLTRGDVAAAELEASRVDELGWWAYREIGRYHAERADADAFLRGWSTYRPAKDRSQLAELKASLITNISIARGWRAAVEVGSGPRFENGWAYTALTPIADEGDVEGLLELLDGDAAGLLPEVSQLSLLVTALVIAAGKNPVVDHPALPPLLDRVIALDPTESKRMMRDRDDMLLRLWPAYGERESLARARAATRTPRNRAQLKVLARDIPVPE